MEGGTFLTESIQKEFGRFVEVLMHCDGKDDEFRDSSLRNLEIQQKNFGTLALPYYALVDSTGKVAWQQGGVVSEAEFLKALRSVK